MLPLFYNMIENRDPRIVKLFANYEESKDVELLMYSLASFQDQLLGVEEDDEESDVEDDEEQDYSDDYEVRVHLNTYFYLIC